MTQPVPASAPPATQAGRLVVVPFSHPQGCRTYLVADSGSGEALAIDVHLDLVDAVSRRAKDDGYEIRSVVDTHTHADHLSGSAALAARWDAIRAGHPASGHRGVRRHLADGERIALGANGLVARHAPGHTPDHLVLQGDGAVFTGDSLFLGSVARTDFPGSSPEALYETIHRLVATLPPETVVYPGHDAADRVSGTIGGEIATNPWLRLSREEFVRRLAADLPTPPPNMAEIVRLNREGGEVPESVPASVAVDRVRGGAAESVIDVRSGMEAETESIAGARVVPLDELRRRVDDVRAAPAPRLLLCETGERARRARSALVAMGLGGVSVVEGGLPAYRAAGGTTVVSTVPHMSLERQVRAISGGIALVGIALGYLVHPAWFALSGFIAAGQVFAGLSGWCGLGLLVARMPWNRRTRHPAPCARATCAASVSPEQLPGGGG